MIRRRRIKTEQECCPDGTRQAGILQCQEMCYRTSPEGMAVEVCPRYQLELRDGQTSEYCREPLDDC